MKLEVIKDELKVILIGCEYICKMCVLVVLKASLKQRGGISAGLT